VSADLIVSYDGTVNDDDALALGRLLAGAGAEMALAYVRHSRAADPAREEIDQHDAERLLELGALTLNGLEPARHVVLNPSTPAGLEALATAEGASVIVFGSEYRTSPGRAEPGTSAQTLLEGGPFAIAIAAAGLRVSGKEAIETVAVAPAGHDDAATVTAERLAERFGARVVGEGEPADLLVVGSQPGATPGRISLSGAARAALNAARGSVLAVPSGTALRP
jgi:hypothetical protein